MISRRGAFRLRGSATVWCTFALVSAGTIWFVSGALTQEAPPKPPAASPSAASPSVTPPAAQSPTAQTPEATFQPGFIDAFGRWLQEGRSKIEADMKGVHEKMGEINDKARDNAKEAAGAMIGLPNQRVILGHERCDVAVNGAPDCRKAALAMCQGKGFQAGKTLDVQAEQKCDPRVLLQGRAPHGGDCKSETYVSRAVCQ